MNPYLRKDLRDFKPYDAPTKPYKIKLDTNESPYAMPQAVRTRFTEWLSANDVNIYPDSNSLLLRQKLSEFWKTNPENIVCGVGSDQIIDYITKTFLNCEDKVLTLKPTFSVYKLATLLNHGKVIELELNDDYIADENVIINTVKESGIKLVFLCTPNSPTGTEIKQEQIQKILENLLDCVIVVDEAYGEFSNETMIPFIDKYENLIVLRTFSKIYGLAGARVGYMTACESLCQAVNTVKAPYNLSVLSEMLAIFAIEESDEYKTRAIDLMQQKNRVQKELAGLPFIQNIPDSSANFLFIASEKPIVKRLEQQGILVRNFTAKEDIVEHIRLSIGNEEQNTIVINAIKELANE